MANTWTPGTSPMSSPRPWAATFWDLLEWSNGLDDWGVMDIGHKRMLQNDVTENPTFKWAMIAIGATVGALLLLVGIWATIACCKGRSSDKVQPVDPNKMEMGQGQGQPPPIPGDQSKAMPPGQPGAFGMQQGEYPPGAVQLPPLGGLDNMAGMQPVPPWEQSGAMPPGIVLAPVVPTNFKPFTSNPRPPSAPQYERLVLVSSRVHQPMKVAEAVLPNVAVVVYDWKNFTMQELLRYIKKVLGSNKVTSLAVIAPGNKPGSVGLLEGATTTPEKLAEKGELAQFWRVLAGCVAPNGVNDGRRVDLLGCRVVESPREGAALLKELWKLTAVPFAAADDGLGGYMLSTFMEEPNTGQLSIISSTIKGIDLYFNRYTLLGIEAPVANQVPDTGVSAPPPNAQYAPPPPAGQPPPGALAPAGTAAAAAAAAALPAGAAGAAGQPAGAAAAAYGMPPGMAPGPGAGAPQPAAAGGIGAPVAIAAGAAAGAVAAGAAAGAVGQPQQQQMQQQQQAPGATARGALVADTAVAAGALGAGAAAAALAPAAPQQNIFERFSAAVAARGMKLEDVFRAYDVDKSGQLSQDEVLRMVSDFVPGATTLDIDHFRAMMDIDNNNLISLPEFMQALSENKQIHAQVAAGRDETMLIQTLHDYLTDNDAILREYFKTADVNGSGSLDHTELGAFVQGIGDLTPQEQKFILSFMYQADVNKDGSLSLDELRNLVSSFTGKAKVNVAYKLPDAPAAAGVAGAGPGSTAAPQYATPAAQASQPGQYAAQPGGPAMSGTPATTATLAPTGQQQYTSVPNQQQYTTPAAQQPYTTAPAQQAFTTPPATQQAYTTQPATQQAYTTPQTQQPYAAPQGQQQYTAPATQSQQYVQPQAAPQGAPQYPQQPYAAPAGVR